MGVGDGVGATMMTRCVIMTIVESVKQLFRGKKCICTNEAKLEFKGVNLLMCKELQIGVGARFREMLGIVSQCSFQAQKAPYVLTQIACQRADNSGNFCMIFCG